MANGKAAEIDKILIHVIKDVYLQSCHVNATFEFDTFPFAWKAAEVTPIPMAGDNIPNNN